MIKQITCAAAFLFALSAPAWAASQNWNITEVAESVSGAQGQWRLNIDGNKVSGDANMQSHTGAPLTYNLEGTMNGQDFTLTMANRTDGKNGCVVNGHTTAIEGQASRRVTGKVDCGGKFFYVTGGY